MTQKNDDFWMSATGFDSYIPLSPEEDTFHSVYIGQKKRENHIGIVEKSGKIHIRGVEYNLDEVHGIILHTKPVMINRKKNPMGKEEVVCFSFKTTPKSTTGKICPVKRSDRDSNPFCNTCRQEMIITYAYTDSNGKLILKDDKPIFIFTRSKGMSYMPTSEYLNELSTCTDELEVYDSVDKERKVANLKKYVTKIEVDEVGTEKWGDVSILRLKRDIKVPIDVVKQMVEYQKNSIDDFIKKFDWSQNPDFASGKPISGYDTEENLINETVSEHNKQFNNINNNKKDEMNVMLDDDLPF